jgi:hypothetical protein
MPARVLVTVGTTNFDALVGNFETLRVQESLVRAFGPLELRIQRGNSYIFPSSVFYVRDDLIFR